MDMLSSQNYSFRFLLDTFLKKFFNVFGRTQIVHDY